MKNKGVMAAMAVAKRAEATSLITSAEAAALQSQITALSNQLTILTNAYGAHRHGYTDVDNLAATLTKQTTTNQ